MILGEVETLKVTMMTKWGPCWRQFGAGGASADALRLQKFKRRCYEVTRFSQATDKQRLSHKDSETKIRKSLCNTEVKIIAGWTD